MFFVKKISVASSKRKRKKEKDTRSKIKTVEIQLWLCFRFINIKVATKFSYIAHTEHLKTKWDCSTYKYC